MCICKSCKKRKAKLEKAVQRITLLEKQLKDLRDNVMEHRYRCDPVCGGY